jgi:hypothetical protein
MLLLPEGQTGEAWEPCKKNTVLEIGELWTEKYITHIHYSNRSVVVTHFTFIEIRFL